jgi:hypothetical protein
VPGGMRRLIEAGGCMPHIVTPSGILAYPLALDAALTWCWLQSPRDKLSCILSCCRVISNLLGSRKYGSGTQAADSTGAGCKSQP